MASMPPQRLDAIRLLSIARVALLSPLRIVRTPRSQVLVNRPECVP